MVPMDNGARARHDEEADRLYMETWVKYRRGPDDMRKIPPTRILMYPDIFERAWGWDRLLPQDYTSSRLYFDYLREYHRRNRLMDYVAAAAGKPEEWPLKARPPVDDGVITGCFPDGNDALTAAARFCLDMELRFMSVWKSRPVRNVELLSQKIQERACHLIVVGREFSEPAAASLVCIANEAALACELLTRGAEATDVEIKLCNCIRQCALSLMYMTGPRSDASAAAMVGVPKEARRMCEWMRNVNQLYAFQGYSEIHKMGKKNRLCLWILERKGRRHKCKSLQELQISIYHRFSYVTL
ncbi:uncharacterized protein [Triticum aestivum]|uniref:uncharacterized protein isoform X1 n=1 Tax=Triticum aestivum TaxID=4565 RepID=UPI001D02092A|nr:uncharacterized protein LOC123124794 isoform X1 [Triticum aestivum]